MGVPLGWAWELCRRLDAQDAADCRRELEKAWTLTEATLGPPSTFDDEPPAPAVVHVPPPAPRAPRVRLEPRPRPTPAPRVEPLQPRPHAEPTPARPAKSRDRLDPATEERIRQRRRQRLNLNDRPA